MSAILFDRPVVTAEPRRGRNKIPKFTQPEPQAEVFSRSSSNQSIALPRTNPRDMATMAAMFLMVSILVYGVSSLFGQVMAEEARRDRIHSQDRMREAQKSQVALQSRMDVAVRLNDVENWATAHGFANPAFSVPSARSVRVPSVNTTPSRLAHVNPNRTLVAFNR